MLNYFKLAHFFSGRVLNEREVHNLKKAYWSSIIQRDFKDSIT